MSNFEVINPEESDKTSQCPPLISKLHLSQSQLLHSDYHILRHIDYNIPWLEQAQRVIHDSAEWDIYAALYKTYLPFTTGPNLFFTPPKNSPLMTKHNDFDDTAFFQQDRHKLTQKPYIPFRHSFTQRFKHYWWQIYRNECDIYIPNRIAASTDGLNISNYPDVLEALEQSHNDNDNTGLDNKLPLAFVVHGGGFMRGSKHDSWRGAPPLAEYFATVDQHFQSQNRLPESSSGATATNNVDIKPYVVVCPNYSLSTPSLFSAGLFWIVLSTILSIIFVAAVYSLLSILYGFDMIFHYTKTNTPGKLPSLYNDPAFYYKWCGIIVLCICFGGLFIFEVVKRAFCCLPRFYHPQHNQDVMQCIKWCDENLHLINPLIDTQSPNNIIIGHSAGASLVANLVTQYWHSHLHVEPILPKSSENQHNIPNSHFTQGLFIHEDHTNHVSTGLKNIVLSNAICLSGIYNYNCPSSKWYVNLCWYVLYTSGAVGYRPSTNKKYSSLTHINQTLYLNYNNNRLDQQLETEQFNEKGKNTGNVLITQSNVYTDNLDVNIVNPIETIEEISQDLKHMTFYSTNLNTTPKKRQIKFNWLFLNAESDFGLDHSAVEFIEKIILVQNQNVQKDTIEKVPFVIYPQHYIVPHTGHATIANYFWPRLISKIKKDAIQLHNKKNGETYNETDIIARAPTTSNYFLEFVTKLQITNQK